MCSSVCSVFVRSLVVGNTSPPMLGGKFENSHGSIIYQRWYKNRNNRNEESIFKRIYLCKWAMLVHIPCNIAYYRHIVSVL